MTGKYGKVAGIILLVFGLVSVAFATDPGENLRNAFGSLCKSSLSILAVASIIMIVLAALVYALGQMLGAETRARATVWATAMFTGAIIAAIIYVIAPWVISMIMTGQGSAADLVRNCCVDNPPEDCANLADAARGTSRTGGRR